MPAKRSAVTTTHRTHTKTARRSVRPVTAGDIGPTASAEIIESYAVAENVDSAQEAQVAALRDILAGRSPAEAMALVQRLLDQQREQVAIQPRHPDEELADNWRNGGYPYRNLLSRKSYERQKYRLQVELLKLQAWVKETGQKVVILFEGRDAAGKGGTIKRFMEHLNPRGARVVALEKPSEAERGQWYFQRYVQHLPTAGEIVMFDRSWYNRAGVERVMGFCTQQEYLEFMRQAPEFERNLSHSGVHLFKFWFSVSRKEQRAPLQGARDASAQAVEAVADRHGLARQVGRVHEGQGSDVLLHRYRGCAVDGDQVGLQEARAAERDALRAAPAPVHEQVRSSASARSTRCSSGARTSSTSRARR